MRQLRANLLGSARAQERLGGVPLWHQQHGPLTAELQPIVLRLVCQLDAHLSLSYVVVWLFFFRPSLTRERERESTSEEYIDMLCTCNVTRSSTHCGPNVPKQRAYRFDTEHHGAGQRFLRLRIDLLQVRRPTSQGYVDQQRPHQLHLPFGIERRGRTARDIRRWNDLGVCWILPLLWCAALLP